MKNIAIVVLVCTLAVGMTGCAKKIDLTVMNHSDCSQALTLSCPDGSSSIGSVGAGGSLSYKMSVPTDQLPAQCSLAADRGSRQTFTVTQDSPSKWWFHIQPDGQIAGPLGKDDRQAVTRQTQEINVVVPSGPVIR